MFEIVQFSIRFALELTNTPPFELTNTLPPELTETNGSHFEFIMKNE